MTKPTSEYYSTKQQTQDGLRSWCKDCCREVSRAKHADRGQAELDRFAAKAKERRVANRRFMDELKAGPCTDCGGRFPPVCMDWDHLPGSVKVRAVGLLLQASRTRILAEIAKCELVCANCHRIRTAGRLAAGLPAGQTIT